MSHVLDIDRKCEFCGMAVLVYIPHECDPLICVMCRGKGFTALRGKCRTCMGTGHIKMPDLPVHGEECKVCYPEA